MKEFGFSPRCLDFFLILNFIQQYCIFFSSLMLKPLLKVIEETRKRGKKKMGKIVGISEGKKKAIVFVCYQKFISEHFITTIICSSTVHSFIRSLVHPFIQCFTPVIFTCHPFNSFTRSLFFFPTFIYLVIRLFYSFIHFIHLFILFLQSTSQSYIHSFIYSFFVIRSFIHSFNRFI